MPNFDCNDPSVLGWELGDANVVPFTYRGHPFYSGVDRRLVHVFTLALDRICAQPGFELHSGSGVDDGMWGYENRQLTGGGGWSFHAYGNAIDVNAPWNPFGSSTPDNTPWRMPANTSYLVESLGLLWGGGPRFGSRRDWMHLENHNTPAEAAAILNQPPLPLPPTPRLPYPLPPGYYYGPFAGPVQSISGEASTDGPYRSGLQLAQTALQVTADGAYGPVTASAIRTFQSRHGLVVDGLIGPRTWAALFHA